MTTIDETESDRFLAELENEDPFAIITAVFGDRWVLKVALVHTFAETLTCYIKIIISSTLSLARVLQGQAPIKNESIPFVLQNEPLLL